MKLIKQFREELSENSDTFETQKLTSLVRSGLFDPHKLTLLKRALAKDNLKMTKVERDTLLDLLDRLLTVVTSSQSTFNKVKRDVMAEDIAVSSSSGSWLKGDKNSDVDINKIPPIVIMKRRAIRVFPGGQKVALYWADRINKYISVPFQSIGLDEGVKIDDEDYAKLSPKARKAIDDARAKEPEESKPVKEPTYKPSTRQYSKATNKKIDKGSEIRAELGATVLGDYQKYSSTGSGPVTSALNGIAGAVGAGIRRTIIANKVKGNVRKTMAKQRVATAKSPAIAPFVKEEYVSRFLDRVARPITEEEDGLIWRSKGSGRQKAFADTKDVKTSAAAKDPEEEDIYGRSKALKAQRDVTSYRANQAIASSPNPNRLPKARNVDESIITKLKTIEETTDIDIAGDSIAVTPNMAKKIVTLHESMNKINKAKMELMLEKDSSSFYNLLDFAMRKI